MLSKGLDSGNLLFHCVTKLFKDDSRFDFTMRSIAVAHKGLVKAVTSGEIFSMPKVKQNLRDPIHEKSVDIDEPIDWILAESVGSLHGFKPLL